ncbi:hypothetical protein [Halocynthiibacter namhaensis]|uniref:hypothetical protein n=1 Tax=Halocynthiibacter namhaensis TaxID=1290553 RepID=UPI0005792E49|nr:hypothetical protein [Halocynthiibacter namhaensis]
MKRFTLIAVILIFPLPLLAEDTWQDDIIEIAKRFSDLAEQQEVIEYGIDYMYPEILVATARALNTSNGEALQAMRSGYETATATFEMRDHEAFVETAQFGVSGDWRWGAVPYQGTLVFRTTGDPLPLGCSWLFVFGKNGDWFFNSVRSGGTKEIVKSGLPSSLPLVIDTLWSCRGLVPVSFEQCLL